MDQICTVCPEEILTDQIFQSLTWVERRIIRIEVERMDSHEWERNVNKWIFGVFRKEQLKTTTLFTH